MGAETQKDPMSQYLMYRATIRSGDIELASECLDNVAGSNMGFELLYACVADSQRVGDKAVIIAAMKKLAEVYDFERPGKVHLPALHRCTIMLLHGLLNADEKVDQDHVVGDMCSMFEEGEFGKVLGISTLSDGSTQLLWPFRDAQGATMATGSLT